MVAKLKEKYEIILGFVTLVISLSAFKDELSKVNLNLGYIEFSLATYFLFIVYGFCICLYFYILERVSQDTAIGNWKLFDYAIQFAFFLFVFIILSPLVIILNLIIFMLYNWIVIIPTRSGGLEQFFSLVTSLIAGFLSVYTSTRLFREAKQRSQEEIEIQEIRELENADKLYTDGYYSHSILGSFKVLETHLFRLLTSKNVRIQRHSTNEIITAALKHKIIKKDDLANINSIRAMRNASARKDIEHNKKQAKFALEFSKQLLERSNLVEL